MSDIVGSLPRTIHGALTALMKIRRDAPSNSWPKRGHVRKDIKSLKERGAQGLHDGSDRRSVLRTASAAVASCELMARARTGVCGTFRSTGHTGIFCCLFMDRMKSAAFLKENSWAAETERPSA
jgi:hypothetical protein